MNRHIKQVAVLGSGVMGSRIALLFASIGVPVILLDMAAKDAPDDKPAAKKKIVDGHLQHALKSNPSPVYAQSFAKRITTGTFEEDMPAISNADWIIEVVIERLDIKKIIFEQVEQFRKKGSIVSSNTSGIPIHLMTAGRSDEFKQHFLGTHFFNPPRYLRLLEIIPTQDTLPDITNYLMNYGEQFLGKTTVLAKDTPAFIGNRIGVFSIATILRYVAENDMSIEEVDKLTGPVIGRPKSATFRTADVVGIDTLALVSNALAENAVNDPARALFKTPEYVDKMIAQQWLGSKTNQGFFKKVKKADGSSEIMSLNLKSLEYEAPKKVIFAALEATKPITNLRDRFDILFSDDGKAGDFYRKTMFPLFAYASNRIPEIADHLYQIDDAIEAGFNWEIGPFKIWEAYGIEKGIRGMEAIGEKPAQWVYDMLNEGKTTFYTAENGSQQYYDIATQSYQAIPGREHFLLVNQLPEASIIWKNTGATLHDIGDGILNLSFHTKMNTIGGEVLQGINKAIDIAEQSYKGLVISNDGANFSAGANVGLIFMMAVEQEYEELNFAIKQFQDTMMRVRYSDIPVVVAPHNMALGGGCEMCLHADMVVAHAELYMGLVEFGVGVIPGGGGTKEFAVRISDALREGDVRLNVFRDKFLTIGQAKVSTSAYEAFELGYLRKGHDIVVHSRNRQLAEAKAQCLRLADRGYTRPVERTDITVLGKEALGLAYLGADSMKSGNYISEHDALISQKLAYVLAGGTLSMPTQVSERYLLDLERRAFLELCRERKTLERLQSIITSGKVLRN